MSLAAGSIKFKRWFANASKKSLLSYLEEGRVMVFPQLRDIYLVWMIPRKGMNRLLATPRTALETPKISLWRLGIKPASANLWRGYLVAPPVTNNYWGDVRSCRREHAPSVVSARTRPYLVRG